MHELKQKNELTIALAENLGKGIAATTDTHTGRIGKVYTLAKGDNFNEFFKNVAQGKSYIVPEDLTREFLIDEMNTWIDLIFEKSQKNRDIESYLTGIKSLDTMVKISRSPLLSSFPGLNRTTMKEAGIEGFSEIKSETSNFEFPGEPSSWIFQKQKGFQGLFNWIGVLLFVLFIFLALFPSTFAPYAPEERFMSS